jgi:phage repressor protein C with HTH and peptisase S24 domain
MPGVASIAPEVAVWRLLEIAPPGGSDGSSSVEPLGVVLLDPAGGELHVRLRDTADFADLEEQEIDLLNALQPDLESKARTMGGRWALDSLDQLSGFLRTGDCAEITRRGSAARAADRLFDEHVDNEVRPFVTHVPVYALRAAATRFGESMDANPASDASAWIRVPRGTRLAPGMFAAHVVGRSMEPLIPDGSLCLFRPNVTGSRQGRRLLIEQFDETDFAARYTVKNYTSCKKVQNGAWEHESIVLEPLNREFPAFDLEPDKFRVLAEFVEVLDNGALDS